MVRDIPGPSRGWRVEVVKLRSDVTRKEPEMFLVFELWKMLFAERVKGSEKTKFVERRHATSEIQPG